MSISESQVYLDGGHYKIGLRGMTFYWSVDQWIRSTKTAEEIQRAIVREKNRSSRII